MYYRVLIKCQDGGVIDEHISESYEEALFTAYKKFPADIMPTGWSVTILTAQDE